MFKAFLCACAVLLNPNLREVSVHFRTRRGTFTILRAAHESSHPHPPRSALKRHPTQRQPPYQTLRHPNEFHNALPNQKRNFGGKDSSGKWVGDKLQEGNAIIDLKPFVRQLVLVFSIYTYILSYSGFAGLRLQGCTRL
jgi:hypothetical protein